MNINQIVNKQRTYFKSQATKDLEFRKKQLKKLKSLIQENEQKLYDAIYKDFQKSEFDTYLSEISFLYKDIDFYIDHLSSLNKPQKVSTNLANLPGSSRVYYQPLGVTLVIGAWNYPYQLSLSPMIAAMAAGNTCVLKPSEIASHTSHAMVDLINENFDSEYLHAIHGGVETTTKILEQEFDKIFFTGSTKVGKIIYKAAAEHLTPVTLELGGKSPAIVSQSANIDVAAKRIVWGKFLNAGQTCVAPDYLLVHADIKDKLLASMIDKIAEYGYSSDSDAYTQIINDKNYERLVSLIEQDKVVYGGEHNPSSRYIAPTIMDNVEWEDDVMQDEIFGPILPIISYKDFDDAVEQIKSRPHPLSAYLFSDDKKEKERFISDISYGGGCINDTVMHLSNEHLPFGGIGNSGMGNYHGKNGFETFSHKKSILDKWTWPEPNLKYPPYSKSKFKWLKRLLNF